MRKGVLLLLVLVSVLSVRANNVQLQGTVKVVSVVGGVATLEVDLSWDNSWRDDYNWDATWLFFKYKSGVNGAWQHAAINATTAAVTGGDYTTMSATTGATAQGLFVYPDKDRGGNTGSLKVQVQWKTSYTQAQFDNNDVFIVAHGIEMVYVPYGAYTIGDGSSTDSFDKTVIDSEVDWSNAGAAFPKGYQGFYVMKYETSQEQYVEFLNTLTLVQQTALIPGVDALNVGDFVFGSNKTVPNYRNGVILSGKIAGKPLFFDNNLNNNKVYSEDGDGGTLAMNYMSITDACGYASWAGLRPMTEMEYEKACRRPYPQEPDAGEYAWNSATGAVNAAGVNNFGGSAETTSSGNVNAGGTIGGPVRCGAFARTSATNQTAAGATYWGVMEMSGNVSELCATITNTTISKIGNGTGTYNANLFGSSLFGADSTGYGTRGGGFSDTHTTLATSSRDAVSCFTDALQRDSTVGFRCAFTYNDASAVDAGTFDANLATICPGDNVTFSGTPAGADGVKITGYVWHVKIGTGAFTIIPGAGGATLTYSNFVANTTYVFKRKAICPLGEAEVSKSYTIPNTAALSLSPLTATLSNCSVTTVTASGATTYSWKYSGSELATTAVYTPAKAHFSGILTGDVPVSCTGIIGGCSVTKDITVTLNMSVIAQTFRTCGDLLTDDCGNTYQTKLMKDGKCWMVQNLRFGVCNATIFGKYYQGSVQNQIAPEYYGACIASTQPGAGYLYNWQGAMNSADAAYNTEGNPSGNVDGNSPTQWQGICPTGWHLPSGGSTGEFQQLYTALGSLSNIYPGTGLDGWQGVLGGFGYGSSTRNASIYGYYWSSTYVSANLAYSMNFGTSVIYPQNGDNNSRGFSVRCVKNY